MKILKTFLIAGVLLAGSLEAKVDNLYEIYDILGIEYQIGGVPINALGAYYPSTDQIRIGRQTSSKEDVAHLRTILHELAHYSGFRENRVLRYPHLSRFQEEIVVSYVAKLLSEVLYEGELASSEEDILRYLNSHPEVTGLTDQEIEEVNYFIRKSYIYLIHLIKKLDKENKLRLVLN